MRSRSARGRNPSSPLAGPDRSTFDWDEARRKYDERLQRDLDAGVDNVETRAELARRAGKDPVVEERKLQKNRPRRSLGQGRPPIYDRDEIVRLWRDDRLKVAEVAARLGCDPRTVIEALRAAGIYEPRRNADKPGPPPRDTCPRGHDQAEHRESDGAGAHRCAECRRIRQRK